MIQVLQQRSGWELGRPERQGLRLARSVPASINAVGSGGGGGGGGSGSLADLTKGKGKSSRSLKRFGFKGTYSSNAGERIHESQKSDEGTTGRQARAARQNVQLLKKINRKV